MKKKMPPFKTDEEMEKFLEQDLSDYLHKGNFSNLQLEFEAKSEKVNLRMPPSMLTAIKMRAKKASMPYQRYIRQILARELSQDAR